MAMTSAAEARFGARVRPEIAVLRARTPYPPRRQRPTAAAGARRRPAGTAARPVIADPYAIIRSTPSRRPRWQLAPARPGSIRLTRRGRFVAALLMMACTAAAICALWLGLARGADAASSAPAPRSAGHGMARVVVRSGQTLWTIAARQDPTADPRLVIGEIIQVNSLRGTVIQPGQVLWVPRS